MLLRLFEMPANAAARLLILQRLGKVADHGPGKTPLDVQQLTEQEHQEVARIGELAGHGLAVFARQEICAAVGKCHDRQGRVGSSLSRHDRAIDDEEIVHIPDSMLCIDD